MDAQDKVLTCATCGRKFTFTIREQEFYRDKNFIEPKHCRECRQQRKVRRQALAKEVPVGTEPGTSRALFEVICAECGKRTQVPFKPLTGKPILCRDCFVQKKHPPAADGIGRPTIEETEPVPEITPLLPMTSEQQSSDDQGVAPTAAPTAEIPESPAPEEGLETSDVQADKEAGKKPMSAISIFVPLDGRVSLNGKGSSGEEEGAATRDRD